MQTYESTYSSYELERSKVIPFLLEISGIFKAFRKSTGSYAGIFITTRHGQDTETWETMLFDKLHEDKPNLTVEDLVNKDIRFVVMAVPESQYDQTLREKTPKGIAAMTVDKYSGVVCMMKKESLLFNPQILEEIAEKYNIK